MMKTSQRMYSALAGFALLVGVLPSCSEDRPAASSSPGTTGTPPAGGGTSIARDTVNPEHLCVPLPQRGSEVIENLVYATAPTPYGGAITPGTYVLGDVSEFQGYVEPPAGMEHTPPKPTTRAERATLYVSSNRMRFIEARSETGPLSAEDKALGFTYAVHENKLELTSECPARGKRSTLEYNVAGDRLTLYIDRRQEVYLRLP